MADRVVIFNRGRVEQIGTPDEIKNHPNSPFVMNFIEDVNIVKSKSIFMRRLGYETDKPLVMMRPEDVKVFVEMPDGPCCPVTVADRYDMGFVIKFRLLFDDEEEIEVSATRKEYATTKNYEVLSRVFVKVDPSKMMGFHQEEIDYFR